MLNLTLKQKEQLGIKDERIDFYFKVENAVIDEAKLFSNIYESHLYMVLSRYCNNNQVAFPSYSKLAELCYCSRTTIIKCMASLENKGYINKVKRKNVGNKKINDTNLYTINNIKEYAEVTSEKRNKMEGGSISSELGVVHQKHQGSAPGVPNKELLIKNNIKKNNTTTKEPHFDTIHSKIKASISKISSSNLFDFLDSKEFSKINNATKKNIRKNIKELSLEKLREVYKQTEYVISKGNGNNFDAILYRGLIGEWNFISCDEKISSDKKITNCDVVLDQERAIWLTNFSGVKSDISLFNYTKNSIIKIPLNILNSNKSKMTRMNLFQFKNHVSHLLKQDYSSLN